ncbi:MAG TPA: hypothetical protein VFZ59_16570 [Verrucomicrobiae bacterium]|nr:hypothetical protein [Verrucomicrobiae bacterium]
MNISSFEELVEYLRNFTTWGNRGGYDFGGAIHLFGASLDNLRKNATRVELEELKERLEADQIEFIKNLNQMLMQRE